VRKFFQNTWTKSCRIFMSMVIVGYSFMYQKIWIHYNNIISPCVTNKWLHKKIWHLVYISHHFSTITNCYLPHVFFYTLGLLIHWKKIQFESCCAHLNMTRVGFFFQNTWTKGCHIYISIIIIKKYQYTTHTFVNTPYYQHLFSTCDT
jgi:hypothetical protein